MTVTIELKPETERHLEKKAKESGVPIEAYLEEYIEENVGEEIKESEKERPFHETATRKEWREEFHRWLESHKDRGLPFLSDEALRRENMYED